MTKLFTSLFRNKNLLKIIWLLIIKSTNIYLTSEFLILVGKNQNGMEITEITAIPTRKPSHQAPTQLESFGVILKVAVKDLFINTQDE